MSVAKHESGGVKHETLTITVNKDEKGYGMTVSGFNPVIIQSVSKNGAAWKAGVRYGDSLLRVNGASVKYSQHQDVVNMIKSSTTTVLSLQRQVSTSKVTAPLPVGREKQLQVEYTTASVLQKMFEQEVRHRDSLLNELDHGGSNSKKQELKATEIRIKNLQQQIERQNQNSCVITSKDLHLLSDTEPPATPPRQGILSNIPRSLSSLTGQSLRGNRHSLGSQPQVTCLDGAPPPLPPRTPNPLSPGGISPRGHSPGGMSPGGMSPGLSPNMPSFPSSRNIEPNSIDVQMNYPLAVTHPPIQSGGLGHQRSRSSPEQYLNNSIDKEWEMVVTPPGTPPPPYPVSQIAIDTQKDIISMEEDDNTNCIISSLYLSKDFTSIEDLNPARMAVFLNWVAGERRPPQAALLYLLTQAYCTGPVASLPRWAYELHSTFLVPGAPLKLSNIDENMAREIDDVLINEYDKEDALRKIFNKVREKAKEEVNQQIHEFQLKRQSGLGTFYGPTDMVLEECERDKQQEEAIILQWLMPRLDPWIKEASNDQWGATYGSSPAAVLAATIYPLLLYTFDLKPQIINSHLGLGSAGTPPRPTFLQRDKHYKQRIKIMNKTTSHPLQVYGHSLNLATVSSYCLCIHCHLPIWGIAPQAYNCTVCKLRVHRHCAKQIEEPCCGPATPQFRISKIMEKLAPGTGSGPTTGNYHQHIDPNQHLHHHHHDKKQRKSTTSNFLHIERNSRKTEEDIQSALDNNNFSPHHHPAVGADKSDNSNLVQFQPKRPLLRRNVARLLSDIELEINPADTVPPEEKPKQEEEEEPPKTDFVLVDPESAPVTLTDSECETDKKKKNKPKHRKTMSMSNTIEMVMSMGDEWLEAAKREIGEHSKKKENAKKKKDSICPDNHPSDVILVLSDATIGETDDFESVVENIPAVKMGKKKEAKVKDITPKIATSQIMTAQKMGVKMIAKASSVGALNFIRKKRHPPIMGVEVGSNMADQIVLSTALFLDSERFHTDMVYRPNFNLPKKAHIPEDTNNGNKTCSEDELEVYYDAKGASQDNSETDDEENLVKINNSLQESKSKNQKAKGLRSRKTFNGSLKRTGGGRRKVRRRSAADDPPPVPPRNPTATAPQKHSNWLFGSSSKGENKFNPDDSGADSQHLPEPWNSVETSDKADSSHSVRQRPVTRAESYRDKGVKVQRTKRKTSDPNQLTSGQGFNDAEAAGNIGAPSGGSSSSSLSSKSNDGGAQPDNDSHSDWSEEEENTEPWSSKAPSDILLKMSPKARKRQDLIHELITTEASHVRSLRILRRIFYIPLGRSNLLPTHEFRALFPNLPDVLQRHRKLCSDLKTLASSNQVIQIRPLADTLISTLGDPKYPIALAKFCGGQRQALEALRIRLKRSKELLSILNKKEQDPICGRLRLQDFLACVWQRLTKYQLLFEGILKNGLDEDEVDTEGGLAKIGHALELSKEILHTVDTAIKTMENEQRLKDIQSKLEIRGTNTTSEFPKSDPGELGRLNLTKHFLVMEGSLSIRQDSNKRLSVLALSLKECLVLLIKEGDKYILKPIPQSTHQPLSPVIDWKRVFFRTNAANKYGFFLVSIEGTQMYDLSAASSSEYNTWTRHLNEAASAFGPRSATIEENPQTPNLQLTNPSVHPTNQDEASNVSESNTSIEEEKDDQPPRPTSPPPPPPPPLPPPINEDDGKQVSGAIESVVGEPHDGDSSNNSNYIVEDLVTPSSVAVTTPLQTLTAHRQITPEERFRQAERKVMDALHEAAEVAKETINPGPNFYNAVETLAGKKDSQKYQWKTSLGNGLEGLYKNQEDNMSTTDLLLHAQYHVNNLTELLFKALRVSPSSCPMTKCSLHSNYGLCDMCFAKHSKYSTPLNADVKSTNNGDVKLENIIDENNEEQPAYAINAILLQDIENSQPENKMDSIVMLEEFGESSTDPHDDAEENPVNSSQAGGLREILTTLLQRLPAVERERDLLKARLQQADQRLHRLHHLHRDCVHPEDGSRLLNKEEVPNQNFCLNDQSGEG